MIGIDEGTSGEQIHSLRKRKDQLMDDFENGRSLGRFRRLLGLRGAPRRLQFVAVARLRGHLPRISAPLFLR